MSGAPTVNVTRGSAYRWAVGVLTEAGVNTPALDAVILLGDATGVSRDRVLLSRNNRLDVVQARRFSDAVGRRCRREPVSRILGAREFYGRTFALTPDVLDPRQDTEALIETSADILRGFDESPSILDLGTGSGAIAVVLACLFPEARVTALDISAAALAVARRNAEANGVGERVRFVRGDLCAVPCADRSFDLVVSNPPYIGETEFAGLPPEVRLGDPLVALVGGPTGTELYRPLARESARLLRPGGAAAVEIGAGQGAEVISIFSEFFTNTATQKDLGGRARVVAGRARG